MFFSKLMRFVLYTLGSLLILGIGCTAWYFVTLYPAGSPQEGYLALTGATVLRGTELEPQSGSTILIRDGIIKEVGKDQEVNIPAQSDSMDLSGYTILPGLIDLHVHLASPEIESGQELSTLQLFRLNMEIIRFTPDKRRSFLNHGVTTIRDLGSEYEWIMEFRDMLRNGELEGPRLFAAGPMFTTRTGHPLVTIGVEKTSNAVRLPATPEEARHMVQILSQGDYRVDIIKIIQDRGSETSPLTPIPTEILNAIVKEAHSQELAVTAHWGTLKDLEEVLAAGVDELQHLESKKIMENWPGELLELITERGIPLSPTLAASAEAFPPEITLQLQERVEEYHSAGGHLLAGSDAGMPGVSSGKGLHRELELLTASGLSSREALKAATSESANVLRSNDIGAIERGRVADFVVTKNNPIQDIRAIRDIIMVFKDGRLVINRQMEE